jgi:hypothetical protein
MIDSVNIFSAKETRSALRSIEVDNEGLRKNLKLKAYR